MTMEQEPEQVYTVEEACPDLKPMEEWLTEEDTSYCRPCTLPPVLQWYLSELQERNYPGLAQELDVVRTTTDVRETGRTLDDIKDRVDAGTRNRLLEFDCAVQSFSLEEEPPVVSPESSPLGSHN